MTAVTHPRTTLTTWWHGRPLRVRLVAITVTMLIIGLGISGVAAVTLLRDNLEGRLDQQLGRQTEATIRLALTVVKGGPSAIDGPSGIEGPTNGYWVLTDANDGSTVAATAPSAFAQTSDVPNIHATMAEDVPARADQPYTVGSVSGSTRWRVMSVVIQLDGVNAYVLSSALPLTDVDATVHQLTELLLSTGAVVLVLALVLSSYSIRRSLRPLREVETTAAAIAEGDLTRRVPQLPTTTEVGRVSAALNVMLAQIESSFAARKASEDRMRRFVADASHELRTPLASIRGYGELYRMGAVPPAEVGPSMKRIEDEAIRMGDLVEDLLVLARLDERRPVRFEHVDLAVVGADSVQDARGRAPDRTVRLVSLAADASLTPTLTWGSDSAIRQVVANLLGNAINHTPAGTPIEIAVGANDTGASVIEVRDHGDGIDETDADRVFERFFRTDESRMRGSGGGSGLGLAIVAAIVESHHGTIALTPTPGGGATFTVTLPRDSNISTES